MYCVECQSSTDLMFCYNMRNSSNCIFCTNGRNMTNSIFNIKYTKEEYEKKKTEILSSYENLEKAKARGAHIYAELAGEGNSLSAYRITDSHPSGDGSRQAIENALRDANISIQDVDYINAHGTSTKIGDFSETNAVKAVFKDRAKQIPMSSTKAQTGHLISAAGAIEGAIAALTITKGKIPMTQSYVTPDPECDLDYVTEGPRDKTVGVAMSNSFGFGGTNNSLVFKHPDLA